MVAQPLTLPRLAGDRADLHNRLAAGLTLPFERDGHVGEIRLSLAEQPPADEPLSYWRCDSGILALSSPSPVLGLLSDCPLLPVGAAQAEQAWYWTLYNQSLAASVSDLVGQIYPHPAPDSAEMPLAAWLTVSWNGIRARSRLQAAASCWRALLERPGWRPVYRSLLHRLSFAVPLILADTVLTPAMLHQLRPGDVIVPTAPYFSPDGQGSILLASWRLQGAMQLTGPAPYHFVIADMETCSMNAPFNEMPARQTDAEDISDGVTNENASMPTDSSTANRLPPLPVTFNIRCGQIAITLPALQRLTRGAILTLRDVTPGEAWLCHGDMPLAKGDLIDIEGKLGLQITQMLSTPDAAHDQESDV